MNTQKNKDPHMADEDTAVPEEIDLPDEELLAMWEEAQQDEPVQVLTDPENDGK